MSKVLGVDVGGTFTDLILIDEADGAIHVAKVPTTPENQAFGVLAGIEGTGVDFGAIDSVVHGTTATTNALLERKISRVGLITTRGFRDVLELGRRTRPLSYGMTGTFRLHNQVQAFARLARLLPSVRLHTPRGLIIVPHRNLTVPSCPKVSLSGRGLGRPHCTAHR